VRTTSNGSTVRLDSCAVLATAAATLGCEGPEALGTVLTDVVAALDLRSAVLRDTATGSLQAVAGDVVHAVPQRRDGEAAEAVVELPVHVRGLPAATLTLVGARPSQLTLLRGLCAVLGLALAAAPAPVTLPLALLEAADAAADAAADDLHDGPVQELVFARFAADATVGGADPRSARDAVQAALQSLRRALWLLRPRGAGEGGLPVALRQLDDRLREAGQAGLALDVDDAACAGLSGHAASVCYRLVQVLARTGDTPTPVRVHRSGDAVLLEVHAVEPLPEVDRWAARARAVGAALTAGPTGATAVSLPITSTPPPAPVDDIEASP
jgi:hypothetical protein